MAMEPLKSTPASAGAIARVSYTHDAMIDMILANPAISELEIAEHFGYSQAWVSRIFCSDAFQARLALRKDDLVTPILIANFEERIKGLAIRSAEVLMEKLGNPNVSADVALKTLDTSAKVMGLGGYKKEAAQQQVQNNFVVAVPQKSASIEDWAREYGAGRTSAGTREEDGGLVARACPKPGPMLEALSIVETTAVDSV